MVRNHARECGERCADGGDEVKSKLPPIIPDPAEWDFSAVTESQLPFVLAWEYARTSDQVRGALMNWLDARNGDLTTERQFLRERAGDRTRFDDYDRRFLIGRMPIKTLNATSAPDSDGKPDGVLFLMLLWCGHHFPKPWFQLPKSFRANLHAAGFLAHATKIIPASKAFNHVNAPWFREWVTRGYFLGVDLPRASKEQFLSQMGRWFDGQSERYRREVRGQAGRAPWNQLTALAAYRLLENLTARSC